MTDNNNNRQPTKAMRMSTLLELQSTPCGTRLGKCCGRVTKIYKSPAKTTLILSCDDEEVCVVTGFHSTKGVADVLKDCIVGKIVKFQLLKAQRFDEARFDGKRLYQTKLLYEFVIQSSTSISVSEADSVHVESIGDLTKAGIYGFTCVLADPFMAVDGILYAVVGDVQNNRADFHLNGADSSKEFEALTKGTALEITRAFVTIEDQCITVKANASDVRVLKKMLR
ncbi:hypothetical protein ACQ4LE_000087 [Meloidogyne hapla]